MARRTINSTSVLLAAGAVLFLAAVLPLRWTGWIGWFRGPVMAIIAPISGPLALLSGWLRPGESLAGLPDSTGDELRQQLEFYKSEYLVSQQRIEEMERVIEALQGGVAFGGQPRINRLEATRIGADPGSGTITVSRGSNHGVTLNTVASAIASPHHLVGVVTNVGPSVSTIQVLTDPRLTPNLIDALVLPLGAVDAAAVQAAVRGQFKPAGDGELAGDMGIDDAAKVQRGAPVYLDDAYWPGSAQRLMIGRVVRVEDTDKPLFKRVVLRPEFEPARVRGVVLRIPADESASSVATPGDTPGHGATGTGGTP